MGDYELAKNMIETIINSIQKRFIYNIKEMLILYLIFFLVWLTYNLITKNDYRKAVRFLIWGSWVWLLICLLFMCRKHFNTPLYAIWGDWLPYRKKNGELEIDCFINLLCFIPFSFFQVYLRRKPFAALIVSASFSLIFECLQVIYSVGSFQISDIVYNGISGMLGSIIYLELTKRRKKEHNT